MYKRLELHNHTTESDASITCRELLELMEADCVDGFALTDHNTISGHRKMKELLAQPGRSIQCIYGMEYTTYYGHILCLNLKEYVSWETINLHRPELLFQAVRKTGALAGIAHPYSYGYPFARGCRFEMQVTDYSFVDFIEVFNNPEPLHEVNEKGLLLWEHLVFEGIPIARTCGMDLHGYSPMKGQYATFITGMPKGDTAVELQDAIHSQNTWISKGPLLETVYRREDDCFSFRLVSTGKPGYTVKSASGYVVSLKTKDGSVCCRLDDIIPRSALNGADIVIPGLYESDTKLCHLVCASPVIKLSHPV